VLQREPTPGLGGGGATPRGGDCLGFFSGMSAEKCVLIPFCAYAKHPVSRVLL